MKHLKNSQKGFTMIELLIAMTIFVIFVSVVISTYTSIVFSQRDANEYRKIYAEARTSMDKIIDLLRNGSIYYGDNQSSSLIGPTGEIIIVSQNGNTVTKIESVEGKIRLSETLGCNKTINSYFLTSEDVEVDELIFYTTPVFDPFLQENSSFDNLQFQPKVTVYANFSNTKETSGKKYNLDFQTTISLRNYSTTPPIDLTCLPL